MKQRRIDVTITLGDGQFGETLGDTVTLTGLRVSTVINSVGGEAQGQCSARIFGLPLSVMNQLTRIGPVGYQIAAKNTILIAAGDEGSALTNVFQGAIFQAYGEMNQSPSVALNVLAFSSTVAALKPAGASSYIGSVSVATIMQDLANQAGLQFENSGVTGSLNNPYLTGSVLDQIRAVAQQARIFHTIDKGVLSIWSYNGYRTVNVDEISLSPQSGMVGYPQFNEHFLQVRSVFSPNAALGQKLTLSNSLVTSANRTWNVNGVIHSLESQMPNGAWFTDFTGFQFEQ